MESIVKNIDCMVGMAEYPDNYFDLAVVDPPYGIEELTGKESANNRGQLNKKRIYGLQSDKFKEWDKAPDNFYFVELFRVSKNQIIWGGNYFNLPKYRCPIVWDKCQPWENFSQVELAWSSFNKPASIIKIDNRTGDKIHPTQKPTKLYDWIYTKYLLKGGKVLDTHLGSGSNRIAADKAGNIDFVGFELDKDYFEAQEKRWEEYKKQLTLW
jgi:site-specific DNA-methyltransferase (adenine-specific)